MDPEKRLSDFSDQQLAGMPNSRIRNLAYREYEYIKGDPEKTSEAQGLLDLIKEIDAGNYINPFAPQVTHDFASSPVKSVRAARTITSVFEALNWIVCGFIAYLLITVAAEAFSNSDTSVGLAFIFLALIAPVVIYYCYKFLYVVLELLADIADDVRRIRLRGE